ncbi:MAG: hypothetical protein KDD43_15330 [Bdellovibrionales bacterium]|nr:hypothetical protein [Bdellovibrionales bacterium]
MMDDLSSYVMTYFFGPGTWVKTPSGFGPLIGVMQPWAKEGEILYSCAIEGTSRVVWVSQAELMGDDERFSVLTPEEVEELKCAP